MNRCSINHRTHPDECLHCVINALKKELARTQQSLERSSERVAKYSKLYRDVKSCAMSSINIQTPVLVTKHSAQPDILKMGQWASRGKAASRYTGNERVLMEQIDVLSRLVIEIEKHNEYLCVTNAQLQCKLKLKE